jgi:acetyltransferase-like isoleucine patch superfamily enzyme
MSWLRKRWVMFRHPHAGIEFRAPVYLGPRFSLDMPRGGTFIVGAGVEFRRGFRAELRGPGARITIGAGSAFTYDVVLQCSSSIEVGAHCMFGQATIVVDGNHRFRELDRPLSEQGYELSPVRIADHVLVTAKCTGALRAPPSGGGRRAARGTCGVRKGPADPEGCASPAPPA